MNTIAHVIESNENILGIPIVHFHSPARVEQVTSTDTLKVTTECIVVTTARGSGTEHMHRVPTLENAITLALSLTEARTHDDVCIEMHHDVEVVS